MILTKIGDNKDFLVLYANKKVLPPYVAHLFLINAVSITVLDFDSISTETFLIFVAFNYVAKVEVWNPFIKDRCELGYHHYRLR